MSSQPSGGGALRFVFTFGILSYGTESHAKLQWQHEHAQRAADAGCSSAAAVAGLTNFGQMNPEVRGLLNHNICDAARGNAVLKCTAQPR
jgi:hypothetical protein